jgi:CRP/FNR family transcriptional regulator, cyclic AMP receptor protein
VSKTPLDVVGAITRGPPRRPATASTKVRRRSTGALATVPLFSGLSRGHLQRLSEVTDDVIFRPGATVMREGDPGATLFVILEGQATVTRGGKALAELFPGDFFGEISLLDRGPRTATVTADTRLVTLRLFRAAFLSLLETEAGMAEKVLVEVAGRLRRADSSPT